MIFKALAAVAKEVGKGAFSTVKNTGKLGYTAGKSGFRLAKSGVGLVKAQRDAINEADRSFDEASKGGGYRVKRLRTINKKHIRKKKNKRKTMKKNKKRKTVKRKTVKRKTVKRKKKRKTVKRKTIKRGGLFEKVEDGLVNVAENITEAAVDAVEAGSKRLGELEVKMSGVAGRVAGTAKKISTETILKSLKAIDGVSAYIIDGGKGTGRVIVTVTEDLGKSANKILSSLGGGLVSSGEAFSRVSTNMIKKLDESSRELGDSSEQIITNLTSITRELADKGTLTIENLVAAGAIKIEKAEEFTSAWASKAITIPVEIASVGSSATNKGLVFVTESGIRLVEWSDDLVSGPIDKAADVATETVEEI
jgi:hypothetical protein